jgi:hypothetical protein
MEIRRIVVFIDQDGGGLVRNSFELPGVLVRPTRRVNFRARVLLAEERAEMQSSTRVTHILALLQAKARRVLRESGQSG